MRLCYRNARTSRRAGVGAWRKQKLEQLLDLKKKGHSRLLLKVCYACRVLSRKLRSQNNVEYDKPLCSVSLVGAWGGGGGEGASKTLIYSIS